MKTISVLFVVLASTVMSSCSTFQKTTPVVKPRYHRTWPTNKWRIDIPVGARHIRILERKRTRVVKMN